MALNCYIDEAGDEGIESGGSRWFVLGALIVPDILDMQTSTMISRIKETFAQDDRWVLHWSQLSHAQKRYVCQELQTEEWIFSCVAADKTHTHITDAPGLKQKYALYSYSARLLLERLSWYARDNGGQKALPMFEYRSNISYAAMRDYFRYLRGWIPPTEIAWDNIEYQDFKILQKRKRRLLQAADCLCGMVRDGFEYDRYGFIEPSYILSVESRLYRRGSNLFSYGLKFLHAERNVLDKLRHEYDWLNKI